MKKKKVRTEALQEFIKSKNVVTISELKFFLQTEVNMTVFRRIKELSYLCSCSHRGKYYTLYEIAEFDKDGLWFYKSILFSIHGKLVDTRKYFIDQSEAGYSTTELKTILKLEVKEPLLNLYRQKKIEREILLGTYIYVSTDSSKKRLQIILRTSQQSNRSLNIGKLGSNVITEELRAAIVLFYSQLNEKQRRLYAGLESLKLGYGGDKIIAELFKIDPHTVSKGRNELITENFETENIRQKGGGRKSVKKNARTN